MRDISSLDEKPLDEKYFEVVDYETDDFGVCTICGNEDILYFLDNENHICGNCYHNF